MVCSSRATPRTMLMWRMPPHGIRGLGRRCVRASRRAITWSRGFAPIVLGLAAAASGCDRLSKASAYVGVPEVIGDTALRFADGSEYVSGFRGVEYIGTIPAERKAPFIIV